MASSLNKVHNKDFVLQLFESSGILVTADSEQGSACLRIHYLLIEARERAVTRPVSVNQASSLNTSRVLQRAED